MIFWDLVGLKLPDICLTGEEKPQKNLTQETCPNRGSNPGPLRDKRACYHLLHSGAQNDIELQFFNDFVVQCFLNRWHGYERVKEICADCVCVFQCHPLHYYLIRVPCKPDKWR